MPPHRPDQSCHLHRLDCAWHNRRKNSVCFAQEDRLDHCNHRRNSEGMADMNQMNDFEEEIERDAKRLPPEGKLEYVRDQVRNMRDLDLRISAYDEELKRMRSQRRELEM